MIDTPLHTDNIGVHVLGDDVLHWSRGQCRNRQEMEVSQYYSLVDGI